MDACFGAFDLSCESFSLVELSVVPAVREPFPSTVRRLPCGPGREVRGLAESFSEVWSFCCGFEPSRPASGLLVEGGLEVELFCGPSLVESGAAFVELGPSVGSLPEFRVPGDAGLASVCGVAATCVAPVPAPRLFIPATIGRAPGGREPSLPWVDCCPADIPLFCCPTPLFCAADATLFDPAPF